MPEKRFHRYFIDFFAKLTEKQVWPSPFLKKKKSTTGVFLGSSQNFY